MSTEGLYVAYVPKTSPYYRTKQQLADDIAIVLVSPLSLGTKHRAILDACWTWTEIEGKYVGCQRWTQMAVMAKAADRKAKLIHEHVVPKKVVVDLLSQMQNSTSAEIYDLFNRLFIGVVVTPVQDQILNCDHKRSMPPEFYDPSSVSFRDPWLRYKPYLSLDGFQIVEITKSDCERLFRRKSDGADTR
jgi:hypothetical protein